MSLASFRKRGSSLSGDPCRRYVGGSVARGFIFLSVLLVYPTFSVLLLCSRRSVLWQSRFRADTVLVSLLYGECVFYDAVAIMPFTSLEKHIDEASPSFSDLGHPQALCSRVLWLIRVWRFSGCLVSWCSTTQRISVFSRITRSSLCVSLLISRLPSHSSGVFVWDRVPLLPSVLAGRGVSAVAVLHGRRFPVTVQRPIPSCSGTVFDVPCFPRWFAVLDTLTTCPLLVTTGVWSWTVSYCRVSAVAVLWWSVPSPSLQVQVPMVLTVQMNNVAVLGQIVLARRCTTPGAVYVIVLYHLLLETHDGASPALLAMDVFGFLCSCVFRSFLLVVIEGALVAWCYQAFLLVLQYIIEYIIWFRAFFAQHRDSRHFGLLCRYCHMLMVASFLWFLVIASMIFAVMGFWSPRLWCRWWCPGWCPGRFWFATDMFMP